MREGKTKSRARRFSVVVVPHDAGDAEVRRFSASYFKLLVAALALFAAFLCVTAFVALTFHENRQLRQERASLQALSAQQSQEIRRLSEAAVTYNNAIKTFASEYNQIARSYVTNQGGAVCTSPTDCPGAGSVASDGAQLQTALKKIEQLDSSGGASQKATAKTVTKLSAYLSSVPSDWPARGIITSLYGGRSDPLGAGASFHPGLDISAPYGEKVIAAGSGVVTAAGNSGDGYGSKIVISHGFSVSTLYGHLSAILVKKGQTVEEGTTIGRVGSSGRSTGDHLHFEIRVDSVPVNPLAYLAGGKK